LCTAPAVYRFYTIHNAQSIMVLRNWLLKVCTPKLSATFFTAKASIYTTLLRVERKRNFLFQVYILKDYLNLTISMLLLHCHKHFDSTFL
jgi:hypothetical protein